MEQELNWISIAPALIALLGAVIIQWLRERSSARKREAEIRKEDAAARKLTAEADVLLTDAWKEQATDLSSQLKETQSDLSDLRADYMDFKAKTEEAIRKLRGFGLRMWAGIQKLLEQICGLDETPAWEPHEDIRKHYENNSLQ